MLGPNCETASLAALAAYPNALQIGGMPFATEILIKNVFY